MNTLRTLWIAIAATLAMAGAAPALAQAPARTQDVLPSPTLVVWAGTLVAVPGQAPLQRQSIVIRDGMITRIVPGFLEASDLGGAQGKVTILDLSKAFVLPGLIDLHVHLTTDSSDATGLAEVTKGEADLAVLAAVNARKTLAAGFTTALDMGTGRLAHERAIYAVRDAINAGLVEGPQILAVGSPLSTAGNSRTQRYVAAVDQALAPEGVCSGADDCRRAVRQQIARGADVINFYNSGSLLAQNSVAQIFTTEEMQAIVSTAHALHRPVIADGGNNPTSAAGINAAILAGVDAIDTATYPDAETWRLLAKSGTSYVPHLYALVAAVGDSPDTLANGSMGWLPPFILEKLYELKRATPAAATAFKRRVPLALGSDAGVFPHGDNAGELLEYVRLGLTPAQAIATATINAAAILRRTVDRGTLEPGKRADLIAVTGNPLEDIAALKQVQTVIRGGKVFIP